MMAATALVEQLAPGLRGERLALGCWPTPVRELDVGADRPLWCKDEGRSAPRYGGNKIRKLEWVLPRVPTGGSLITAGAVGSNHVLAAALHGGRRRLKVDAVLVGQPDTPAARRNAGVSGALLHRVWPARSDAAAVLALGRAVRAAWREDGRRPAVVWIGGSTPHGVLGWVEGGLELATQVAAGELPAPRRIYVPAGSGGIAAGLLVGLRAAGLDAEVHAVRVADRTWANRRAVLTLARLVTRRLRRAGARIPDVEPRMLVLDQGWFGARYGQPTRAGERASELARAAGVPIDPTYSAKTLAAALAAVHDQEVGGPVLWIDTANAQPLEAILPGGTGVPDPSPTLEALLRG
jgi:D-cysteine desulfhydrase